jgi:hypothetical protein
MRPVEQTCFDLKNGNCFAACIASILELPLEEVPNFCGEGFDAPTWFVDFSKWAEERGLAVVSTSWPGTNLIINNSYAILCGKSHRGNPHAIVGASRYLGSRDNGNGTQSFEYDFEVAWDPCQESRIRGLSEVEMVVFLFTGIHPECVTCAVCQQKIRLSEFREKGCCEYAKT